MVYLEPFFALIRERIVPELLKLDAESAGIRHWYVVEDSAWGRGGCPVNALIILGKGSMRRQKAGDSGKPLVILVFLC